MSGAVIRLAILVALASCAHPPTTPPAASAPQAGPAPDPFAGLTGTIVTTRQRVHASARSLSAFVANVRADQTERVLAGDVDDGMNRLWLVHFAAFFERGATKGYLEFKFFDLTGGKRELIAQGAAPGNGASPGVRSVYGDVQLAEPWFVPERRYEMTIEQDRLSTASTSFWLLPKRDSAAPPPVSAALVTLPADMADRVRRASGSTTCAVTKPPPDPGQVRVEDRGYRSSPGLRFTGHDKDMIRQIIRRRVPAVRACYEAAMTAPPYPRGRMLTRFVIGPEGGVRGSCAVDSDLKVASLEVCILDELLTMKFPEAIDEGWVVVEYPFVVTPADDAEPAPAPRSKPAGGRSKTRQSD